MTIDVDPATRTLQINIAGRFDAAQARALLRELAAARARIVRDPDHPGSDAWTASRAPLHACLANDTGPDGRLTMRIPGLGWVGSTLSPRMRAQLIRLLIEQQGAQPGGPTSEITPAPRPRQGA